MDPRDYQRAIDVHSAVNLSGVVHSFAEVLVKMHSAGIVGTAERNRHPISVMYALAIVELAGAGIDAFDAFERAYAECRRLAGAEDSIG